MSSRFSTHKHSTAQHSSAQHITQLSHQITSALTSQHYASHHSSAQHSSAHQITTVPTVENSTTQDNTTHHMHSTTQTQHRTIIPHSTAHNVTYPSHTSHTQHNTAAHIRMSPHAHHHTAEHSIKSPQLSHHNTDKHSIYSSAKLIQHWQCYTANTTTYIRHTHSHHSTTKQTAALPIEKTHHNYATETPNHATSRHVNGTSSHLATQHSRSHHSSRHLLEAQMETPIHRQISPKSAQYTPSIVRQELVNSTIAEAGMSLSAMPEHVSQQANRELTEQTWGARLSPPSLTIGVARPGPEARVDEAGLVRPARLLPVRRRLQAEARQPHAQPRAVPGCQLCRPLVGRAEHQQHGQRSQEHPDALFVNRIAHTCT